MSGPDLLKDSSQPKLASFVRLQYDETRERWMLQGPERVLVIDDTGKEILARCSGQATIREIIEGLAKEYDAPSAIIEEDVFGVLRTLAEKNLLVDHSQPGSDPQAP